MIPHRTAPGERHSRETAALRWFGLGFAITGGLALLVAVAGSFAAASLWVRSRAPELALRRAVGATRVRIVAFVLLRTRAVGAGSAALGLFLPGVVLRPPLARLLAGLPARDSRSAVGVAILLLAAALAAAVVPTAAAVVPTWNTIRTPPARLLA